MVSHEDGHDGPSPWTTLCLVMLSLSTRKSRQSFHIIEL